MSTYGTVTIEITELLALEIIAAFACRIGGSNRYETRNSVAENAEKFICALPEHRRDDARDLLRESILIWTTDEYRTQFSPPVSDA